MNNREIQVVAFCGGHGGAGIYRPLIDHPLFSLTVIVNAYDDGLSTGDLRAAIPGFLGPSDVRKNLAFMVDKENSESRLICELLSQRLPTRMDEAEVKQFVSAARSKEWDEFPDPNIRIPFAKLSESRRSETLEYLRTAVDYLTSSEAAAQIAFENCSFGNLLLAGMYLKEKRDFAAMVERASELAAIKATLLATSPADRWLVGLAEDGQFMASEAAIVNNRSNLKMREVFLLESRASQELIDQVESLDRDERYELLRSLESIPDASATVISAIASADVILCCPGTQNSSLYPSYMTRGVGDSVARNTHALTCILTNIGEDLEIPQTSSNEIIRDAAYYLDGKRNRDVDPDSYFDRYFVNDQRVSNPNNSQTYVRFERDSHPDGSPGLILRCFDEDDTPGTHDGDLVRDLILETVHDSDKVIMQTPVQKLSIIIPAYNESKYIAELIRRVRAVDLSDFNVVKELIVVDDGSSDNTIEIVSQIDGVRLYQQPRNMGKGAAVARGIKEATGDYILVQDADLEYDPNDIRQMLHAVFELGYSVVYGSRSLHVGEILPRLKRTYGKHPSQYWSSYIAGKLINYWGMMLYWRHFTDLLTGYKLYRADIVKSFNIKTKGFETDHELTAKVVKHGESIYEVPVKYEPRTRDEGKKIKWTDGVKAIWTLLRFRFFN